MNLRYITTTNRHLVHVWILKHYEFLILVRSRGIFVILTNVIVTKWSHSKHDVYVLRQTTVKISHPLPIHMVWTQNVSINTMNSRLSNMNSRTTSMKYRQSNAYLAISSWVTVTSTKSRHLSRVQTLVSSTQNIVISTRDHQIDPRLYFIIFLHLYFYWCAILCWYPVITTTALTSGYSYIYICIHMYMTVLHFFAKSAIWLIEHWVELIFKSFTVF